MKRILNLLLIMAFIMGFNSCKTTTIVEEIGAWSDNIKLSTRTAEFNALGDSVIVTTGGLWWWINNISVNGRYFRGSDETNYDLDSYSLKGDCYTVERRKKNTLFIKVGENNLNEKRVIIVRLEAGDYFDSVTITQKAK